MFVFLGCANEENSAKEIFERYEGEAGVVSFHLPPGVISLFMDEEIGPEMEAILSEVDKIKVITIDEHAFQKKQETAFSGEFEKAMRENKFVDVLIFSQSGETVKFRVNEDEEYVRELVVSVENPATFFAVSLVGTLDMKKIMLLAQNVQPEEIMRIYKEIKK